MAKKKDTTKSGGADLSRLAEEVKQLRTENADLRKRLDKIAGLAEVPGVEDEVDDDEDDLEDDEDDDEMLDDEDLEEVDEEEEDEVQRVTGN